MPSTLDPPAQPRPALSRAAAMAKARGVRRAPTGGPCPPLAIARVPEETSAAHLVALLHARRQKLVGAGELHERFVWDVRRYSGVLAAYGHIRRLARTAPASAHVATSMPQLVAGLARYHPEWEQSGDAFEDRDRYQSTVREHLTDLVACGLITWQPGFNDEGEYRRTELLLLDAPHVQPAELELAEQRLSKWRGRYPGLDTRSSVRVPNAPKAVRELPKAQRARLARARCQAAAGRARVRVSGANGAPPFGASPASQEEASTTTSSVDVPPAAPTATAFSSHVESGTDACGRKTGVTRTSARADAHARATPRTCLRRLPETAASDEASNCNIEGEVRGRAGDQCVPQGPQERSGRSGETGDRFGSPEWLAGLLERVRVGEAEREQKIALTARQEQARMLRVAGWDTERGWPVAELQRAWVTARHGARALHDVTRHYAGPVSGEELQRLRRAAARWERAAGCPERPKDTPTGGLAMLLHLANHGQGKGLAGTITELDRWSKDLAAATDLHDPHAARRRFERACKRHGLDPDTRLPVCAAGPLGFRARASLGGRWAPWVACDEHGRPLFECRPPGAMSAQPTLSVSPEHPGQVVGLRLAAGHHAPGPRAREQELADALLVYFGPGQIRGTGRHERLAHPIGQPAEPSDYLKALRARPDADVLELARRTGLPHTTAQTLLAPGGVGRGLLEQERRREDQRAQADSTQTRAALTEHARQAADPRADYRQLEARWRDGDRGPQTS